MKVLNFGSINIDITYQVKDFVQAGETISSSSVTRHSGGKGFNQSLALARAGIHVYHAGCIGSDGLFLKEELEQCGVNTEYLKLVDSATGNAIIQVNSKGNNCIILYAGANHCVTEQDIDAVLQNFCPGDVLLIQNEINNLEYLVDKAYAKGMKIAVNPSPYNESITENILKKSSWLLINQVEAQSISGHTKYDQALSYLAKLCPDSTIIMTLGSEGVMCMDNGRIISHTAYKVNAVDTTGAGDTFTGYYLAAVLNGGTQERALELASKAASLSVQKPGAAESIPSMEQVEASFLQN